MSTSLTTAGLLRRFAAMFYDAFLIVAIWMISTMILVATVTDGSVAGGIGFQLFLYIEIALFYIYFWRANGQTLGMQVWRIKLIDDDGNPPALADCVLRFLCATLSVAAGGLGFAWVLINKERLTWHDMASNSKVVFIGKNETDEP